MGEEGDIKLIIPIKKEPIKFISKVETGNSIFPQTGI